LSRQFKSLFSVHSSVNWVLQENGVLAERLKIFLPTAIAIGLIAAAPARAEELIDVAALDAQVEAATELAELPTEPDWGVTDQSTPLPVVTQDAPEVPAPATVAEAAAEPRYHSAEPQYHTEYHATQADPAPAPVADAPAPVAEQAPAEATVQTDQAPATPAPTPVSPPPAEPAAAPEAPASPTIWIWVWNWSWDSGSDGRYRNTDDQYQIDPRISDADISRIAEKIGRQIPIQISVQTGNDIADEVLREIPGAPAPVTPPAPVEQAAPAPPLDAYRAPPETQGRKGAPTRRGARVGSDEAGEPAYEAPPAVATTPVRAARDAASTPRKAKGGKWPRARRVSRRAPSLPLPGERLADSAAASGASASLLKTIAILALSLLLAAFGYWRRNWLPVTQLRGLLGTRTDPPG
jgi:hypothetical protein